MSAILDFGRTYLPDLFTSEFAPCHAEIAAAIEAGGTPERRGFVFGGGRGMGFSTLLGVLVPLYYACERPDAYPVVLTDGPDEAQALALAVHERLRPGMLLRRRYPQAVETTAFRAFHGSSLRGLRSRGRRPDLLLLDGIVGDLCALPPAQRQERENRDWQAFTRAVLPLLGPEGLFVYRGPLDLDADPLLAFLMMSFATPLLATRMYPAADRPVTDDDAVSFWPQRWSIDQLRAARLTVGAGEFDREWLGQ